MAKRPVIKTETKMSGIVERRFSVELFHELPRTTMTSVYPETWTVSIYIHFGNMQSCFESRICKDAEEANKTYNLYKLALAIE